MIRGTLQQDKTLTKKFLKKLLKLKLMIYKLKGSAQIHV